MSQPAYRITILHGQSGLSSEKQQKNREIACLERSTDLYESFLAEQRKTPKNSRNRKSRRSLRPDQLNRLYRETSGERERFECQNGRPTVVRLIQRVGGAVRFVSFGESLQGLGKFTEADQGENCNRRRDHRQLVEPASASHPDAGDQPDARRGSQAVYPAAVLDDCAGAQETYAGNDLSGDPRDRWLIGAGRHFPRDYCKNRCAEAYQEIGPKPRRLAAKLSLEPYPRSKKRSQYYTDQVFRPNHYSAFLPTPRRP